MITLRIEQGENGYYGSYHIYAAGHELDGHNISPFAKEKALLSDFGDFIKKLGITEDVTIIRVSNSTTETVSADKLAS